MSTARLVLAGRMLPRTGSEIGMLLSSSSIAERTQQKRWNETHVRASMRQMMITRSWQLAIENA